MSEPVPAEPVPLQYANGPSALPPPIPHAGMYPPIDWRKLRTRIRQFGFGVAYAATTVILLGRWAERCFPNNSQLRLAQPAIPMAGMFAIGFVATRFARSESKKGYAAGLWFGGFVALGLIGLQLLTMGYVNWIKSLL